MEKNNNMPVQSLRTLVHLNVQTSLFILLTDETLRKTRKSKSKVRLTPDPSIMSLNSSFLTGFYRSEVDLGNLRPTKNHTAKDPQGSAP